MKPSCGQYSTCRRRHALCRSRLCRRVGREPTQVFSQQCRGGPGIVECNARRGHPSLCVFVHVCRLWRAGFETYQVSGVLGGSRRKIDNPLARSSVFIRSDVHSKLCPRGDSGLLFRRARRGLAACVVTVLTLPGPASGRVCLLIANALAALR